MAWGMFVVHQSRLGLYFKLWGGPLQYLQHVSLQTKVSQHCLPYIYLLHCICRVRYYWLYSIVSWDLVNCRVLKKIVSAGKKTSCKRQLEKKNCVPFFNSTEDCHPLTTDWSHPVLFKHWVLSLPRAGKLSGTNCLSPSPSNLKTWEKRTGERPEKPENYECGTFGRYGLPIYIYI